MVCTVAEWLVVCPVDWLAGWLTGLAITIIIVSASRGRSVFGHNFQNRFNYKQSPATNSLSRHLRRQRRKMTTLHPLFTVP